MQVPRLEIPVVKLAGAGEVFALKISYNKNSVNEGILNSVFEGSESRVPK